MSFFNDLTFEEFVIGTQKSHHNNDETGCEKQKPDPNPCLLCEKKFGYKSSLRRHVKRVHLTITDVYTCNECERNFSTKNIITKHMINVHLTPRDGKNNTITCFKCEQRFGTLINLIMHLKCKHHLSVEKEMIQFPTMKDFDIWRKGTEESTNSKYVVYHTQKTQKGYVKKYVCNRSGIFNSRLSGRRRTVKKSTCKIGQYCASHIHIRIEKNGQITGWYYPTHTSHSVQLRYLPLMEWEEKYICDKLKQGFSCIKVLRDIQNDVSYERRQFVTYYHVYNMAKKYNLICSRRYKPRRNAEAPNNDAIDGNDDAINGNNDAVDGNNDAVDGNYYAIIGNDDAINGNNDAINGNDDAINGNDDAINGNDDEINGNGDAIDGNDDAVNGKDDVQNIGRFDMTNVLTQQEIEEILMQEQVLNSDHIKEFDLDDINLQLISDIELRLNDNNHDEDDNNNNNTDVEIINNPSAATAIVDEQLLPANTRNKLEAILHVLSDADGGTAKLDNEKYDLIGSHLDAILQIMFN